MKTKTKVTDEFFKKVVATFKQYREYKRELDEKIIHNNAWFKTLHQMNYDDNMLTPSTGFLFNAIANKHADAMDNYPEPNIIEQNQNDTKEASVLSKIIPVQLEINDFKATYSRAWWYKLKNGACAYGVFFNNKQRGGLGDIEIKRLDLLNLFWEPYINNIQASPFLFITAFDTIDNLTTSYPDKKAQLENLNTDLLEVKTYDNKHTKDVYKNKVLVIDCYYKKPCEDGGVKLHLLKFCADVMLCSTEETMPNGLYDHGLYPVVIDPLFPEEDSPVGFGLIDIIKNPQLYIDKLDYIISKNALISGKVRYLIKDNGGINEDELADFSRDVIHVAGSIEESNIRQLQASPLDSFIMQHRVQKISELKEIAGNRDFQQGGSSGGVTAYGAIVALQQAGEKMSRDMINEGYLAYKEVIYMMIELVRQFFDDVRSYRVTDNEGKVDYINYSNKGLKIQQLKTRYVKGEKWRKPEFSVSVIPQKHNPYNKINQNQMAIELYKLGIFDVRNVEASKMLLELMQFDGKEKIVKWLEQKSEDGLLVQ